MYGHDDVYHTNNQNIVDLYTQWFTKKRLALTSVNDLEANNGNSFMLIQSLIALYDAKIVHHKYVNSPYDEQYDEQRLLNDFRKDYELQPLLSL